MEVPQPWAQTSLAAMAGRAAEGRSVRWMRQIAVATQVSEVMAALGSFRVVRERQRCWVGSSCGEVRVEAGALAAF
ncbi:hypothetical protein VARIO8X_170001 [Burkholderiales bacterium 8X]|nr:hypothetical protein VARIO8X_170001 [Burkholderiales bacterium 8X]